MSFALLGILQSQTLAAGGAGAYDLLETTVLTSSASSVSFTGLDSYTDYKHLQIRMVARDSIAVSTTVNARMRFNSDAGNNYAYHFLNGYGSGVVSSGASSQDVININECLPGGSNTAGIFGSAIINILDFSNSSKNSTVRYLSGTYGGEADVVLGSGLWTNTNAITSILLLGSANFVTGSRFSLYGIK